MMSCKKCSEYTEIKHWIFKKGYCRYLGRSVKNKGKECPANQKGVNMKEKKQIYKDQLKQLIKYMDDKYGFEWKKNNTILRRIKKAARIAAKNVWKERKNAKKT